MADLLTYINFTNHPYSQYFMLALGDPAAVVSVHSACSLRHSHGLRRDCDCVRQGYDCVRSRQEKDDIVGEEMRMFDFPAPHW